jgi:excisionase family DNA binding protein
MSKHVQTQNIWDVAEKLGEIYVSPSQAAAILGVNYSTVMRYIKSGKIKAYMVAGRWKIPLSEVLKLIKPSDVEKR